MAENTNKGFLHKAYDWGLKWPGLFGIPFYIFAFGFIGQYVSEQGAAGLAEGVAGGMGDFYSITFNTAATDTVTGLGFIFNQTAGFVADTLVPGLGTLVTAITGPGL